MCKVLIWGTGFGYEEIINQIMFESAKGNLSVSAVVSPRRRQMSGGGALDGAPLISKAEIPQYSFEFVIVTSDKYFWEIQREAVEMGISADKIINGSVFKLPMFDFKRYLNIFKTPITILSDDCWGGHIYHMLCMKFYSPLINIYWPKDSYAKLIQDPAYYFSQPLKMEREGNLRKGIMPVGSLGDGVRKVEMIFPHATNYLKAEAKWNERVKRVNLDNIFVKMAFDPSEPARQDLLEKFAQVPYRKICFYSDQTDISSVIHLKHHERQSDSVNSALYVSFEKFILERRDLTFKEIDLLKMLNGEQDFFREK